LFGHFGFCSEVFEPWLGDGQVGASLAGLEEGILLHWSARVCGLCRQTDIHEALPWRLFGPRLPLQDNNSSSPGPSRSPGLRFPLISVKVGVQLRSLYDRYLQIRLLAASQGLLVPHMLNLPKMVYQLLGLCESGCTACVWLPRLKGARSLRQLTQLCSNRWSC